MILSVNRWNMAWLPYLFINVTRLKCRLVGCQWALDVPPHLQRDAIWLDYARASHTLTHLQSPLGTAIHNQTLISCARKIRNRAEAHAQSL